jgi:hypothetical protein
MLTEPVKDVSLHVLNVLVDQPVNVPTVSKTLSLIPTPELVLPALPATSDKKKSMEPVKESVKLVTSTKMVLVSLESAPLDSKITDSEDV